MQSPLQVTLTRNSRGERRPFRLFLQLKLCIFQIKLVSLQKYCLNMDEEVVYFSVNNWFSGRDYPPTDNFKKWLGDDLNQIFRDDKWAKENRLCIYCGVIDMSYNYTIAAPRSWVEKNCPELLTDEEYTYVICSYGNDGVTRKEYKKKYSDFVDHPDEDGVVTARFGWPYLEYNEENFGVYWRVEDEEDKDDEE